MSNRTIGVLLIILGVVVLVVSLASDINTNLPRYVVTRILESLFTLRGFNV